MRIEDKFSINVDHFLIDDNKTTYICLRIEDDAVEYFNAYRINDSRYFKIFKQVLEILSSIYDDFNRKENTRHKFKRFKMTLEMSFHLFYNHFLCFATIAEISKDYLLKELKDRVFSRMQKTMFDVSFIAEILNELKIYLTQLNNRQRYYIVSRASSKNEIVVATSFKSFDAAVATKKVITSKTFFETFTRSRENISTTFISRSDFISRLQDLFEQTICYNYNEVNYFADDYSHFSKVRVVKEQRITRINKIKIDFDSDIESKSKNE